MASAGVICIELDWTWSTSLQQRFGGVYPHRARQVVAGPHPRVAQRYSPPVGADGRDGEVGGQIEPARARSTKDRAEDLCRQSMDERRLIAKSAHARERIVEYGCNLAVGLCDILYFFVTDLNTSTGTAGEFCTSNASHQLGYRQSRDTAAIGRYNRRNYGGDTVVNETICTVGLHAVIR